MKLKPWLIWTTLVVLSLVALGRGCIVRPATNFPGAHFNRGANAAWLGVEWVQDSHQSAEIAALAQDLQQREIRYVFVFVSYLKADGRFNPTYSYAAQFTGELKQAQPDFDVQAWIGLPLAQISLFGVHGHVDISDAATRQKIVAFCRYLILEGGFEGIHVDAEPVPSGDTDFLTLLDEIRQAVRPAATLSVASRRIWPIFSDLPLPLTGLVAWRSSYYREVARHVDQIAVMTYDSAMPLPQLYRQWTRFQVIEISQAVEGTGVTLFFGVPTSEETTWTHWPSAENMKSSLQGVTAGLNDTAARPLAVTGVAIYPYWETDAAEWATYTALWLGR